MLGELEKEKEIQSASERHTCETKQKEGESYMNAELHKMRERGR